MSREAMLYEKREDGKTACRLCAHACVVASSKRGICGVRENREGILYALNYGRIVAENVDPIEKKPLFHFLPGSRSYSIASAGCNFRCRFCQNYEISQMPAETGRIPGMMTEPGEIVRRAVESGSRSISYTYTEPTIFFEFAYETAKRAREEGLRNVFVTNGYMTGEALDKVEPYLDAANVDLKAFTDDFYRKYCGARLEPVLGTLKRMKERKIWLEVTTLVIPGLNDGREELRKIAGFIRSIGPETPWHISRFHPRYRMMDLPPTELEKLHEAAKIGKAEGLEHVYTGNVPGDEWEQTRCSRCGTPLVRRFGYSVGKQNLKNGACPECGTPLAGVFD